MKYLIMTEGTCEQALLNVLIEKEIFFVSIDELVYKEIHHARQLKPQIIEKINQLSPNEKITIIRVGDKLNDFFPIPKDIKKRVIEEIKICIKPEFEILHLIQHDKFEHYQKHKSNKKASEYLMEIDKTYKKSYEYNYAYFNDLSINELYLLFELYDQKRKKTHFENEYTINKLIRRR